MVSVKGVEMDPLKVWTILQWPISHSLKHVRAFLGLSGYYRKFIKQYATLACPLTDLLKKDFFKWSEDTQLSFETLKQAMTTTLILALPKFSLPFIVEKDYSGVAISAILSQNK